ncbi:hypothetical protein [Streptomyces sp. NPDC059008]|uniref:hypothetical protein n=1 Tax=Streptomyces sp. NPDC059008 TaxID=3346693 RepID=UPI00368257CC
MTRRARTDRTVCAFRAVATWPHRRRRSVFDNSDRARVRAQARKWAAAGATVEFQRHLSYGRWKTLRTLEPTEQPEVVEQAPEAPVLPVASPTLVDEADPLYERLMQQAPGAPGRHRGRTACRHVAGGKGIR